MSTCTLVIQSPNHNLLALLAQKNTWSIMTPIISCNTTLLVRKINEMKYTLPASVRFRQHTSAYISIRQHPSAYLLMTSAQSPPIAHVPWQVFPGIGCGRFKVSVRNSIRQHTSAYVGIRVSGYWLRKIEGVCAQQHTSAYVGILVSGYCGRLNASVRKPRAPHSQFTCFPSTTVQILTQMSYL